MNKKLKGPTKQGEETEKPKKQDLPSVPDDAQTILAKQRILIIKELPRKFGQTRKISHLWDNHWRVDFHETDQQNYILDSYFVTVTDGTVHAQKEQPVPKKDW